MTYAQRLRRDGGHAHSFGMFDIAIKKFHDLCRHQIGKLQLDPTGAQLEDAANDFIELAQCMSKRCHADFRAQEWMQVNIAERRVDPQISGIVNFMCHAFANFFPRVPQLALHIGKCLACLQHHAVALPLLMHGIRACATDVASFRLSPSDDAELVGICLVYLNRPKEALPWLRWAASSLLATRQTRCALGRCLASLGQADEALSLLRQTCSGTNAYWYDMMMLGFCYLAKKDRANSAFWMARGVATCAERDPPHLSAAQAVQRAYDRNVQAAPALKIAL